jgi:hypothetical protein
LANKPLFVISYNPARNTFLVVSVLVLLLAAKYFLMGMSGLASGIVACFFALFPLYYFAKFQRLPIRYYRFQEDSFMVYGKERKRQSFGYDEVVRLESTSPTFAPWAPLRIYLKGQTEPIVLPLNPDSKILKTDLHSWLRERTRLEFTYSQST